MRRNQQFFSPRETRQSKIVTNEIQRKKVSEALVDLGASLQNDKLQIYRIMAEVENPPETKLRAYHVKLAVALLDTDSSVDIAAASPRHAITIGEHRQQLRYLLDPTVDFEEYGKKPLRAAELDALLNRLKNIEIPAIEQRPIDGSDDSLGAVFDQCQALVKQ